MEANRQHMAVRCGSPSRSHGLLMDVYGESQQQRYDDTLQSASVDHVGNCMQTLLDREMGVGVWVVCL